MLTLLSEVKRDGAWGSSLGAGYESRCKGSEAHQRHGRGCEKKLALAGIA